MPDPTPIPVASGVKRVLLFGGVFDPPHAGHVSLAVRARDDVMGKQTPLVFVPAARSPHKPGGAIASDAQRLEMLTLALDGTANCSIWTDEIDRGGASYWVETLRRASSQLGPQVSLRFLIGADQAVAFHRWGSQSDVLALASPIVMLREPMTSAAAIIAQLRKTDAWNEGELERWSDWVWAAELVDTSSTVVRETARRGERLNDLNPRVRTYIEENALYEQGERA